MTIGNNDLRPLTADELGFCDNLGGGVNLNWGNVAITWVLFTVVWKVAFERAAIRGYDRAWAIMGRNVPRLSRRAWAVVLAAVNRGGAQAMARNLNNPAYPDWQIDIDTDGVGYSY